MIYKRLTSELNRLQNENYGCNTRHNSVTSCILLKPYNRITAQHAVTRSLLHAIQLNLSGIDKQWSEKAAIS